jgi:hydroxyethylthiazole kinase
MTRFASLAARLAEKAPRVQCLTNTVAQPITANVLLALGARVSMATHQDEVVAMTSGADAVLINLGTLDPQREAAIARLLEARTLSGKPVVLDPVFVEHSPLRLRLASSLLARGVTVIKGNATEIAQLKAQKLKTDTPVTWVTTGAIDKIERVEIVREVAGGHRYMAQVTGMGCALGAVIAAFTAIEPDPVTAAEAATDIFGQAGLRAGSLAQGPGSFAVHFIDALAAARKGTS